MDLAAISHGHVVDRPDGQLSRCGGLQFCEHCQMEAEIVRLRALVDAYDNLVEMQKRRYEDSVAVQSRCEESEGRNE